VEGQFEFSDSLFEGGEFFLDSCHCRSGEGWRRGIGFANGRLVGCEQKIDAMSRRPGKFQVSDGAGEAFARGGYIIRSRFQSQQREGAVEAADGSTVRAFGYVVGSDSYLG
jgi:hypothetical protein